VLAGAGSDAEARVASTVRAFAAQNADITATAGSIVIDAASLAAANADASGVSGGAVGIGASKAKATIDSDVEARVDRFASLDAADDIVVRGRHNMTPAGLALAGKRASASASASGGGAISGNGADVDAISSTDVKALVNSAASLAAGDDITIAANASNEAFADSLGLSIGLVGVGSIDVDVVVTG
jgi:acyl-CoA hydrolase